MVICPYCEAILDKNEIIVEKTRLGLKGIDFIYFLARNVKNF